MRAYFAESLKHVDAASINLGEALATCRWCASRN
jgi:hypothetical protein